MNCILEQVINIVLWGKDELKDNKNKIFPYSYEKNHVDKISFILHLTDSSKKVDNIRDWINCLKKEGLIDIKFNTSIKVKNKLDLLMPEKQDISIICIFKNRLSKFVPRWIYVSETNKWKVTYSETPCDNFVLNKYTDNTENFKAILYKLRDYYIDMNDSSAEKFEKIINILLDDNYNDFKITANDALYNASNEVDYLFCGMGSWFDCLPNKMYEYAEELYKQERLALLYCINQ